MRQARAGYLFNHAKQIAGLKRKCPALVRPGLIVRGFLEVGSARRVQCPLIEELRTRRAAWASACP